MDNYYKNSIWKDIPDTVMIELSNSCNFRCAMCSNKHMTRKKGFMTIETFKRALDACEESGIKNVKLYTTGESILHPDFMGFWRIMVNYPFNAIMVSTNGSLLKENMINELVKSEKLRLQFSFSGWDKQSYEMRYVNGDFEKTIEKIKLIISLIKKAGLPKETLTINGAVSGNRGNIKRTEDFLETLGLEKNQMKIHNANNWISVVLGKADESGYEEKKNKEEPKPGRRYYCHIANTRMGILYDGKVTACGCLDVNGELVVGDINEEGIKEIRKGDLFKEFTQKLNAGNLDSLMCRKCDSLKWIKPHT